MVHDVAARREARGLKKRARELVGEAKALESIEGAAYMVEEKKSEAARLRREADELQARARLEDLSVRQETLVKQTKRGGERTYYRWVASWREGEKTRKAYLGSCKKMSQGEALQKARKLKADGLGLR